MSENMTTRIIQFNWKYEKTINIVMRDNNSNKYSKTIPIGCFITIQFTQVT